MTGQQSLLSMPVGEIRGAVLSPDGVYRYELSRHWGPGESAVAFVMLNPSTADATQDDSTIRRCVGFAKAWGYDGLRVLNLFAYRATDPKELARATDPVGPDNDEYLARRVKGLRLVAAWGANSAAGLRAKEVTHDLGLRWQALGVTKDGSPRHPLYVRGDAVLVPWAPEGSSP